LDLGYQNGDWSELKKKRRLMEKTRRASGRSVKKSSKTRKKKRNCGPRGLAASRTLRRAYPEVETSGTRRYFKEESPEK